MVRPHSCDIVWNNSWSVSFFKVVVPDQHWYCEMFAGSGKLGFQINSTSS